MQFLRLDQISREAIFQWVLMAFLAGNVNAGGFMACERFVTHLTGFATLFGINVAEGRWFSALGMLSVPAYFLLGCMVAAYFTDAAFIKGRKQRFGLVMVLVAGLLALVAFMGHFGHFGAFGTAFVLERDYFLLVFLCTASGLQNAAITAVSRGVLRATHMTGLVTDLGIGLVRAVFGHADRRVQIREFQQNWMRVSVLAAFGLGGVVGALSFRNADYLGFLLPAMIALYCGNLGMRMHSLQNDPTKIPSAESPNAKVS